MSAAELQAYGWRKQGLIWRKPKRHLTVVPTEPAEPRCPVPAVDRKTATCVCGAPMVPRASRCQACYLSEFGPTPARKSHASDAGVDELMEIIGRNLRATPVPPLPVHVCDCGCLLRLDEALCPECRDWAERAAVTASWLPHPTRRTT